VKEKKWQGFALRIKRPAGPFTKPANKKSSLKADLTEEKFVGRR
jgi:hypothetical protein